MIEHFAYLNVEADLTLTAFFLDQSFIHAVFVPYLLISIS